MLASLLGALLGAFATGAAAAPADDRIPGHYIVVLEDSVESPGEVARAQLRQHGGKPGLLYRSALKGYSAQLSRQAVESLRANPRVKYVAPDRVVELDVQTTPDGIERIFAPQNPLLDIDGVDDVRIDADVAVIDTGIDYTHPDLNVVEWVNCVPADEKSAFSSCVENSGVDGNGHGTHVAGTVAALDNDLGVVGAAPGARLWAIRVLGNDGTGAMSWIVGGIDWVSTKSEAIEVANISIGGSGTSLPQSEAIKKSVEKGVVYAVSAGNSALNTQIQRPANHPDVITVSALADYDGEPGGEASPPSTCRRGSDDGLASFSNWGSGVELAAPGACVYSTLPGGSYGSKSGTSMATPHVTGAAALLAAESNPQSKADVEAIRDTLVQRGSLQWDDSSLDGKPEPLLYLGGQPLTQTEVATGGATNLDGGSATLHGAINPRGRAAQYRFEWGTTTAYGQSAPAVAKALGGTGYTVVSESIGGLKPDHTYHYRLVAIDSEGTTYGQDRTVTPSRWALRAPAEEAPESKSSRLNDVSCTSTTFCMGALWYYTGTDNRSGSYRLANGEWRFDSMPVPSGGDYEQVYGVSCTSTSACTAVGKYQVMATGLVVPLVERWNGTAWSVQSVPVPYAGSPYTRFKDVSCASSSECVAVGYFEDATESWRSWSALWRNGAWSVLSTPVPSGATESELSGVSCPSSTHCVAVGDHSGGKLLMRWDGSSWSLQTPAGSGNLYGVDCLSGTFCMAVGDGSVGEGPVAEVWNGTQWTRDAGPVPSRSTDNYFWDVSCKSAAYCTAVGAWFAGDKHFPLTQVWDGASWRLQANHNRPEATDHLIGVSCLRLAACVSVGESTETAGSAFILERRDASTAEATGVTARRATLHGTVDPAGVQTSYHFELGPTTAYGAKLPTTPASAGSGADPVEVTQEVTGLEPWTTYHVRLVATNASGTAYGEDVTFKTQAATPTLALSFGTSGAGNGQLNRPKGMAVDKEGNVWVADCFNHRLQKFTPKGEFLTKFGSFGSAVGQLNCPQDVAITAAGDLWVTDSENDRVQKFSPSGQYLGQFGSSGTAVGKFTMPKGIAVAPDGTIWVTDHTYRRVQQFSATGAYIRTVSAIGYGGTGQTSFFYPDGIAVDGAGNVWVADRKNHKVQKLSSTGQFLLEFGTLGTAPGQLELPTTIDVTAAGHLVVADRSTGRVQQFTPTGEYVTQFGPKTSGEQEGIAVGPGGTTYVPQGTLSRVEKWVEPVE